MIFRTLTFISLALTLVLVSQRLTVGQENDARSGKFIDRIPGIALSQADALGKRLKDGARSKTVYSGQFFDKDGNSHQARIIHQLPGLVRLEGLGDRESVLSFNGKDINGSRSRKEDESLMEVFVMDSAEGMFESMKSGAAVRFLGRGFGPDPRIDPDYSGPRYDIYEVTAPVRCRQDKLVRAKMYYFDTATRLLQSTRYYDPSVSPAAKIETRYSEWGERDGSRYPARIAHYVGEKLQFEFVAESISGEESVDKTQF